MKRRKFLQSSGLITGGFLTSRLPIVAGPFKFADFFPTGVPDERGWIPNGLNHCIKEENQRPT